MKLRIELDKETARALVVEAVRNRRPMPWQAEVLLRQSLGLEFPPIDEQPDDERQGGEEVADHE